MRNNNNNKGKDKSKQKEKDQNKDKDNSSNQDNLSIQVSSSSSNRLKLASKKRKDITPNAYGSMTDADVTGLTQSPKGQKSSRFVCYDEKEDNDDNEEDEEEENEGEGEGREGGVEKGKGKGKGRDRLFRSDDFNNISTEGDPDLDVEGMWREVGGEIGGEKEKVKKRDDIVRVSGGGGDEEGRRGMKGEEGIGMFKGRNSDIGTIKQIERLLRRQSDSKERERGGDERSGFGDFSGEEDSDDSNDTTTLSSSCPSPSPSPSSSSSSSSSPGSMSSGEYSNHDNNNSSSSSDGDIDALVIKEQEISKMIQLSQSVRHFTLYCVIHSFIHSYMHHLFCFSLVINCFLQFIRII